MLELIKIIAGLLMLGVIVTSIATVVMLWWKYIMFPIMNWIFPGIDKW